MLNGYRYLEAWIPWDGCIEDMEFGDQRYDQFEKGDAERFKSEWPTVYQVDEFQQLWIYFHIDMTTGEVTNWPEGKEGGFRTVKVVDGGKYRISDVDNKPLAEYEGYVPELLSVVEKGYGDYLEFYIDKNKMIPNWRVNDGLLEDFMNNI